MYSMNKTGQALSPLEQLHHCLVCAQFQQNINIVLVFEETFKLDHTRMIDRSMQKGEIDDQ